MYSGIVNNSLFITQSSDSHQIAIRQSSDSHQTVIRQSSDSQQTVIVAAVLTSASPPIMSYVTPMSSGVITLPMSALGGEGEERGRMGEG